MSDQSPPAAPPPEEMAKMGAVAQAGETAAAEGKDAGAAMKEERDKQGMDWLSDEHIDRLANALIGKLDERGAFESTEPVQAGPAAPPPAPPAPGEPATAPVEAQPQPQKQSWAARFMGS